MAKSASVLFTLICITLKINGVILQAQAPFRPRSYASILQDTRNEPTPDGTFGYLYKTEDGIVSSARGGPNGVIQGGFSYTDPTGLKVNINYNAGSRKSPTAVEPSSRKSAGPEAPPASRYYGNEINPRPRVPAYRSEPQNEYYDESIQDVRYQAPESNPRYITRSQPEYRPQPDYRPQPEYRPQPKYSPQPEYVEPEYRPQSIYRPRRIYRPPSIYQGRPQASDNEIYDDYRY